MAMVAQSEKFVSRFALGAPLVGQHVWLDGTLGLVTGTYPTAEAKFDFGDENLVSLKVEPKAPIKKLVSHVRDAKRKVQRQYIETETEVHEYGNATQLLVGGLDLVEDAAPGTLEKLAQRKARSKRAVAKAREDLYETAHPDTHSQRLKSGYYVATNNKGAEARGYLREAIKIAGLRWGTDFSRKP